MNINEDYIISHRLAIGAKLRDLREAKGLTQDQLGELVGLGKSAVSRIEAGKWNFGIDTLTSFCISLQVDLKFIIRTPPAGSSGDDLQGTYPPPR